MPILLWLLTACSIGTFAAGKQLAERAIGLQISVSQPQAIGQLSVPALLRCICSKKRLKVGVSNYQLPITYYRVLSSIKRP
jgi:hypothetical protein